MQPYFNAIRMHRFSFLSMPGVISVGLGIKIRKNFYTGFPSLTFGVKKKLSPHSVPSDQLIPRHIDHLPTDVIEVGNIRLLGYALPQPGYPLGDQIDIRQTRLRPAQPGVSIGHYKTTAGTFGAVVKGNFPGGIAILSNNHILANGTSGRDGLSRIGDAILQPGPYDNGTSEDIIARLYSFCPLISEKKFGKGNLNSIDAALAVPIQPDLVTSSILDLGSVSGTAPAQLGMAVLKSGRTTGVTKGMVFSVGNTIRVEGENKTYIFEEQIGITAKSEGGDSGSLVVNQSGKAVGLLASGSKRYTFINPIDKVLDYFGASL